MTLSRRSMTTRPPTTLASIAALLVAGASVPAQADTAYLRSGHVLSGTFLGATPRTIHLQTREGLRRLPVSQVSELKLEPRPEVEPAASAPRDDDRRVVIVGSGRGQSIERHTASN